MVHVCSCSHRCPGRVCVLQSSSIQEGGMGALREESFEFLTGEF